MLSDICSKVFHSHESSIFWQGLLFTNIILQLRCNCVKFSSPFVGCLSFMTAFSFALSLYSFSAKKKFALVWGSVSFYDDRREKCTLVLIEELTASARKPSSTHSEFCFYGFSNLFFAIKLFFLALLASFWASSQCSFFLPNTKLKAYKNHHKDSEGKDFLLHIIMQASCLFSHFVKSPYFVKKKKKNSIKIWIFGMKNHGKLTF